MKPEILNKCCCFFQKQKTRLANSAFKPKAISAQFMSRYKGNSLTVKLRDTIISSRCEFTLDVRNGLTVHDIFPNGKLDAMFFDEAGTTTMFGMKYPIDVIYLDRHFKVVVSKDNVQPARWGDKLNEHNSVNPVMGSRFVLELPAGSIGKHGITLGDLLEFTA